MDSERRVGLEQEFLLVDEEGRVSTRADDLLARCARLAENEDLSSDNFSEECSRSMVEIKTRPASSLEDLENEYLANVGLAARAARELGLRLYPLASYPLPLTPSFRDSPRYELQIETIGRERFLDAGRCFGVHLHLEVEDGVVDEEGVISPGASPAGVRELLDLYNLATALDPALIALTRSCPFYEGRAPGLAARTAFYRGSERFGWSGVYAELPELGSLPPYATSARDLVERQERGCELWREAMDRAGVESERLPEMSDGPLDICWRPVRVSGHGTVELRNIDANHPDVILAISTLVEAAADRVRTDSLRVQPVGGLGRFELDGSRLLVPDFEVLGTELFYAAATAGTKSPEIIEYLDSVFDFAAPDEATRSRTDSLSNGTGAYRTTEAEILRGLGSPVPSDLDEERGLDLVREACDLLEKRVLPRFAKPG